MNPKLKLPFEVDEVTREFIVRHGEDSGHILALPRQKAWYLTWLVLFVACLIYRWDVTLFLGTGILAFIYFAVIAFRSLIVGYTLAGHGEIRVAPEEIAALRDEDLPVFTILIPLYHEANVAGKIVKHLGALDYPPEKLDFKLLLEEDDTETIASVRASSLDERFDVMVIPDALPKTKPKACNHGLRRAKGELCVIYDAEDQPEPDQLKKVVIAFSQLSDETACVQAKLNFYNRTQNLMTRWFTIEYSTNFDLFLPGLQHANIPMPLGGTSNHFRTDVLRACGGWDPFNVTEDCELGVRIYRRGYRTAMLDSTTWEEANPHVWNWVRQRSRWVKGFFQTHLAHMRNPYRTFKELGLWGMIGFLITVGGSSLMLVLNLLFWIAALAYGGLYLNAMSKGHGAWEILRGPREAFRDSVIWPMLFYGPKEDPLWSTLSIVFFVTAVLLFFANFAFVWMHVMACIRRKYYDLIPYALLMPLYWVLISIGAWKGFLQLFTKPFYWEKTHHGLTEETDEA